MSASYVTVATQYPHRPGFFPSVHYIPDLVRELMCHISLRDFSWVTLGPLYTKVDGS